MRNLHEFIPTFVRVSFAPNQPEMIANRLVSTRSCNRKTIPSKSLKSIKLISQQFCQDLLTLPDDV